MSLNMMPKYRVFMPTRFAISATGMLACQQIAMMKFRFGIDLPDEALAVAEEAAMVSIAMRDVRLKEIAESKKNH